MSPFVSAAWDPSEFLWSSSLRSSLPTSWYCLGVDSRTSWSLPDNFTVPSAIVNMKFSPLFLNVITSFALSHRAWIPDAQVFQLLSVCNQNISIPDSPRLQCISEKHSWQDFLTQIGGAMTGVSQKSEISQPLLRTESLGLWMVLRIVSHRVFSDLPGDLQHFAESNRQHSIESAHHFSSKPDCNSTADVPFFFILRTALSAIPFVSDRWGVEVRWFHDRPSHDLPNSNELSV